MSLQVKNTTEALLELVCPHYCMGCGELGAIMCERCKTDNSCDVPEVCLECGGVVRDGHCGECRLPFDRGYALGGKEGLLERCVSEYKYKSVRALKRPLAEMMAAVLPCLPEETVVVPVPTNEVHVRMRGLDHTLLMARELARVREWKCEKLVARVKNSVQVGADMETRRRQAEEAYGLDTGAVERFIKREGGEKVYKLLMGRSLVVVDDVWTTGATMKAVCEVLRRAGAGMITAIVLARA